MFWALHNTGLYVVQARKRNAPPGAVPYVFESMLQWREQFHTVGLMFNILIFDFQYFTFYCKYLREAQQRLCPSQFKILKYHTQYHHVIKPINEVLELISFK